MLKPDGTWYFYVATMIRAFAFTSFVLGLAGCAPDERMPLADCEHGLYWADCGGNEGPVLGCDRETGECRWFSGGVTARGHATSACAATDPCCQSNWPFTDFSPDGRTREETVEDLSLIGRGVVDRSSDGQVTVQFDLTEETPRRFEFCTGGSRCERGSASSAPFLMGAALVKVYGGTGQRWELEIIPGSRPTDWTVHLYRFIDNTREGLTPPLACSDWYSVSSSYPLVGVLHLSSEDLSDPEAVHGRLEAESGPFTFEFEF